MRLGGGTETAGQASGRLGHLSWLTVGKTLVAGEWLSGALARLQPHWVRASCVDGTRLGDVLSCSSPSSELLPQVTS